MNGRTALETLRAKIDSRPQVHELWIDPIEKLDLGKLTVSDLTASEFSEEEARRISTDLLHGRLTELAKHLNVELHSKFRVIARRRGDFARLYCETEDQCQWIADYLRNEVPGANPTPPFRTDDSEYFQSDVRLDGEAKPYVVLKALIECPACLLVNAGFTVTVAEQPHFSISPENLAAWIEDQGDTYWSVDGDSRLMSRMGFSAPADDLSAAIRDIGKPLLIADPSGVGGAGLIPEEVGRVVEADEWGHRVLQLAWQGDDATWLLIEDDATD